MDNAGSTSRAMSADRACTEITLPQASSAQTPPAAQNDGIEGNAEVVSTPQAPRADMRFDTLEDAQRHYLAFARRRGFGIRYNYRKKSEVTGEYIRVAMVCHKAGHQAKEKEDTQKPKPVVPERMKCSNIRTDCPARMALKVRDGTWLVTEFCDDHNHPLLKKWSLTGFLRSHRDIPEEDQEFIKILHTVNMETSRMMQVMATLYESVEGVSYTPKDMANFRSKLQAENKYIDMQNTMAYFEDLKSRDKDFYYRYKLDDEDHVQYLFWVDSAARKAYKNYNDCISFDATYMTNKYKMPFAPFIGINNHGQSIQLGYGFLKNELSESYIWLFESFLIAMDGVAPVNIITDQDGSMRAGIEKMFPNTTHRNCRWHIVDKATEEIGPFVAKIPGLREEMNDCINCSLTPQEFETRWNLMIQKYNVQNHEKIAALYQKRNSWVPAYFMQKFYPFLQTTQRSEGFNAVLKKYISPANSVLEFVLQYDDIQAKIMKAEKKEEADSSLLTARSWSWHPIEKQMEKLYTKNIHARFLYEMSYTMSYNIRQAMVQLGVCQMPLAYVLRRWTWSAEENLVEELPGQPAVMPEESKKKMWLAVTCNEFKRPSAVRE
ncbi:hypothetical protein ACQ4PT_035224 [Festuca glaucescens]